LQVTLVQVKARGRGLDASLQTDLIEERAAILQYCAGLSRTDAENKAAQMHGFKDWREYVKITTRSN
jgi:hypothetical protein